MQNNNRLEISKMFNFSTCFFTLALFSASSILVCLRLCQRATPQRWPMTDQQGAQIRDCARNQLIQNIIERSNFTHCELHPINGRVDRARFGEIRGRAKILRGPCGCQSPSSSCHFRASRLNPRICWRNVSSRSPGVARCNFVSVAVAPVLQEQVLSTLKTSPFIH